MKLEKLIQAAASKKAVLLDLDNTLYVYKPCHEKALKKTWQVYGQRIQKISFPAFTKKYNAARKVIHHRLHGQATSHSRLHYFQILLSSDSVSLALDFE